MARAGSWISSSRSINATPSVSQGEAANKPFFYFFPKATNKTCASLKGNDLSLITKRSQKVSKRLVTISTSDGRWHGEWNCDYIFTLRDLQLEDLAEDHNDHKNTRVAVKLCIHKSMHPNSPSYRGRGGRGRGNTPYQYGGGRGGEFLNHEQHTGFGLSVDGRITTSFTRKCSNCSLPYCREIDTGFKVWVLPSAKQKASTDELPLLGWEDPSVIYVKPGFEADLDSLIQDTIRLATSVKETCSESCEKAEPKLQPLGKQNAASIDKRWSRLLELKKGTSMKSQ